MKKIILATIIALAPAVALAADKKEHPPEKAMDAATPEMKNPDGTEKLHPPQKAMDEATPTEKKADAPASGGGGNAQTEAPPAWDVRKAGEGVKLTGAKE